MCIWYYMLFRVGKWKDSFLFPVIKEIAPNLLGINVIRGFSPSMFKLFILSLYKKIKIIYYEKTYPYFTIY